MKNIAEESKKEEEVVEQEQEEDQVASGEQNKDSKSEHTLNSAIGAYE
jgi:hypothetical protein